MNIIDCMSARSLMLEAELAELRGEGGTDLAGHIRTCSQCRAHGQRILRGYVELDSGLRSLQRRRPRPPWRLFIPLPLAVAAMIALILVQPAERDVKEPTALAALMFRESPVASPPAGKQAIVLDNRDVVVVWLY